MILYINACVREDSRTDRLARALLKKLGGAYEEAYLPTLGLAPVGREMLALRDAAMLSGDHSGPEFAPARQFAAADTVVVAAPYWDLSFPSLLKVYLENIYVQGVVTRFNPDGTQVGLCRADKLYYVSTAGGPFTKEYGYEYVASLVKDCFGVKETELLYAEMLDIQGYDAEEILRSAMQRYGLCE